VNTKLLTSVVATLLLTLGVVWLYPNQAYSQVRNQTGNKTGNCDPAYPNVCIALPPPNLNCPDVPYEQFTVLPPDPHGFDRDGNGIGCEGES
jgi:hypothetical protein